jgi:glyoxylase-like metal-dependent hydrolase (beta-lactamase superfamily II)
MRPYGFITKPINGTGRLFGLGLMVTHCLLIDTGDTLILVDSGYGLRDYSDPSPAVRWFNRLIGVDENPAETAVRQVAALGYQPEQVTDIFLTHMHLDHTGGLPDFPAARVHVYRREYQATQQPRGLMEKVTYRPEHYAHNPNWLLYDLMDEPWHELPRTAPVNLDGVKFFFVPFHGHSRGHCAVVVVLPSGQHIIHAGDSYAHYGQVDLEKKHYPPLSYLARPFVLMHPATRPMFRHESDLRKMLAALPPDYQIFCAHDPHEFETYKPA